MSAWLAQIGAPEIVAGMLVAALNAYVLTGGADLGSGVWDLMARGKRRDAQRDLIAEAIGPIWEANHVWLVIVVVICFTAFPPAFAAITTTLHIPLTLMLFGIVMRGSAFVFRSHGGKQRASHERWGRLFAIASSITPVLLGIVIGAIATGGLGAAARATNNSFATAYITPWLAPFPIALGALTLALVAELAATYLTLATNDRALRDDFRNRAIWSGMFALLIAMAAGIWFHGFLATSTGTLLVGMRAFIWIAVTVSASGVALAALVARRFAIARLAASAQVSLILWGWVVEQYPNLLPPDMSIRAAAASHAILVVLIGALVGGGVILFPSLGYLLKTFSVHRDSR